MMDLSNAAILAATVFTLVELLKRIFPGLDDRITQASVFAIGIIATIIVAHSDWGSSQIISGKALSDLNLWSLVLVGMMAGSVATVGDKILASVSNIGQNQPSKNSVPTQPVDQAA